MNEIQATMPVQPANSGTAYVMPPYGYGGNNGGFGDGNNAWWVIILLLAMGRGWGGNNGGGGGYGSNAPYIINTSTSDSGNGGRGGYGWQDGFNHAAVMSAVEGVRGTTTTGFGDTALGIAGLGRQICETGGTVTAAVTNGFSAAEIAANARAMSAMERSFAAQTAVDNRLDAIAMENQRCCCEQKAQTAALEATVLRENCEDRYQAQANTRDIIENQNRNNQAVLDKLCQLELDGVRQNYENQIRALQAALDQSRADNQSLRFDRSQVAQTAQLVQDNNAQTAALLRQLNPAPVPAYPVQNPNCCYNNGWNGWNNGCGCAA